jgi:hypothetical protein
MAVEMVMLRLHATEAEHPMFALHLMQWRIELLLPAVAVAVAQQMLEFVTEEQVAEEQ